MTLFMYIPTFTLWMLSQIHFFKTNNIVAYILYMRMTHNNYSRVAANISSVSRISFYGWKIIWKDINVRAFRSCDQLDYAPRVCTL